MDIIAKSMRGIYRDILKGENNSIIYDSGWVSNTIMDRCRMLLAGFMKNDPANGVAYLAVGQGLEEWDGKPAEDYAPDPTTTTDLENRYEPAISDLELLYLDASDNPVVYPTRGLQITATLNPGYPTPPTSQGTYPLREFGLFGSISETDYMINCIRHPVIHKGESSTLIRVIRLYF